MRAFKNQGKLSLIYLLGKVLEDAGKVLPINFKSGKGFNNSGKGFSPSKRFSITDSVPELTIGHRRRISMPKFEQKRSSLVIIVAQISTTAVIEHHMQP